MTDKTPETTQDDRAKGQSPVLTTPANKRVPPQGASESGSSQPRSASRSVLAPAALVLALIAVGLSGGLWLQQRHTQNQQAQLAARFASNESTLGRAGADAQNALRQLQAHQARIQELQQQLGEATAVIQDLDEALRNMTDRGSDLVLLNDVDHLATIAQQQLELGGNVRNAIVALESAQAQLARANRPALASLLQTVNGDLDRLRAASTIDVGEFSRQLEELAVLVGQAPLIMPDDAGRQAHRSNDAPAREQPAPTVPPSSATGETWWEQAWQTTRDWSGSAWNSLREDLGKFIDVRRVDDPNALLMSPDQSVRFRENLRTRIMTAQLALMMRQPEVWKTETEAIVKAIETRYDDASPMTRRALRLARSMADATIDTRLPTVDNTLHALNTLREEQTRKFGDGDVSHGMPESGAVPADSPYQDSATPDSSAPNPGTPNSSAPNPGTPNTGAPEPEGAPVDNENSPTNGQAGG